MSLIKYLIIFELMAFSLATLRFSRPKEAPYLVSIRRTEYEKNFGFGHHHCSGALIDTTTVVTAASCLYDSFGNALMLPKSFTIVAGTRYLIRRTQNDHGVIREVDKIVPHPQYDPADHSNDIAFLKVVIPFDTTSGDIKAIAISDAVIVQDTVCTTYGWGWLNESDSLEPPTKLQYTSDIQIEMQTVCTAKFEKFGIHLQEDKVCAQVKHNKDNCRDLDAGGILVCYKKLVGVVSTKSDCYLYEYPTVYTHVSSHNVFLNKRRRMSENIFSPGSIENHSNQINPFFFGTLCIIFCLNLFAF